jgi:hypothetical protein
MLVAIVRVISHRVNSKRCMRNYRAAALLGNAVLVTVVA